MALLKKMPGAPIQRRTPRISLSCTEREQGPWWQVDLQDEFLIDSVKLLNRPCCADRLRHFSLLKSRDGTNWQVIYRKTDDTVFGNQNDVPLEIMFEPGEHQARFIRVQIDGEQHLHFRKFQVFGRKPAADDDATAPAGREPEAPPATEEPPPPPPAPQRKFSFWSFLGGD